MATSLEDFSKFLYETYGVESNTFTITQALAAAKCGGSGWQDFGLEWHMDHPALTRLRGLLMVLKKPSGVTPTKVKAPPREMSPTTARQLVDIDKLGSAGMPEMFDPAKGPRVHAGGEARKPTTMFDLSMLRREKLVTGASTGKAATQASKAKQKEQQKEQQAALAARTILVVKPTLGWLISPSSKLVSWPRPTGG